MVRETLAWILVIAVTAALVIYVGRRRSELENIQNEAERAEVERMLDRISRACDLYRSDFGEFPPGDGSGSAELARALQASRPEGGPYFGFHARSFDRGGNIANPAGTGGIIYYRRGEGRFELWCRDAQGRELSHLTRP